MDGSAAYSFPSRAAARRFVSAIAILWISTPASLVWHLQTEGSAPFFIGWLIGAVCLAQIVATWRRWYPDLFTLSFRGARERSRENQWTMVDALNQLRAGIEASGWNVKLVGSAMAAVLAIGLTAVAVSFVLR